LASIELKRADRGPSPLPTGPSENYAYEPEVPRRIHPLADIRAAIGVEKSYGQKAALGLGALR